MSKAVKIIQDIETGDVSTAFKQVKKLSQYLESRDAYSILCKVYSLCYNRAKGKCSPDNPNAVFELTNILCQTISATWNCDRTKFMQILYHINSYLLQHNLSHSRKISQYFFELKAFRGSSWESNENIVIVNLVLDFLNKISERCCSLVSDNSFGPWLDFIFRLFELNDQNKLYKLFIVLDKILLTVNNQLNDRFKDVRALCLTELTKWLDSLILSGKQVETTNKDLETLLTLTEHVLIFTRDEKNIIPYSNILVECLSKFKELCVQYEGVLGLLVNSFKMFSNIRSGDVSKFDFLYSSFTSRPPKMSMALPTIFHLFHQYRSDITASLVFIDKRIVDLSKFMVELLSQYFVEGCPLSKTSNSLLDFIYSATSIITCSAVSKTNLIATFTYVKVLVKRFNKLASEMNCEGTRFSVGVSAVLSATEAYRKAELYEESVWLCRYCFSIFLKFDPNVLWEDAAYLKYYVEFWLNTSSFCYGKTSIAFEAQIMYIILATFQPKFTAVAMAALATLKNSKVKNLQMVNMN